MQRTDDSLPEHLPVMVAEVLEWLEPRPGEAVVDGTIGLGGHALRLAAAVGEAGHVIGIDRDPEALEICRRTLAGASARVTLASACFGQVREVLEEHGIESVDRALLDLGVSSLQLERPERGFSFRRDGPLDMRMTPAGGRPAADLVATLSDVELARIFYEFGEERFSRRIARTIVETRTCTTINSTARLAELVASAVPRRGRIHPATRVFQALRIAVNDELGELTRGLPALRKVIRPGGRLVVISFHSLEDRIVKNVFREWAASGSVRLIRKKVVKPSREECRLNRRARSAKLRVCEVLCNSPAR